MYFNKGSKWHWTGTWLSFEKPVALLQTTALWRKLLFWVWGSSAARVCPRALVQRHVADAVSLPAAACGMYSHPRDPGALWRKNSRLPHGSSLPGWQRYNLAAKDQLASGFPYYLLLKWQSVVFGSEHSLFTFVTSVATFRLSLTLRQLLTCKYAIISNILVQLSTQFFPLKKTVDTSHTE